MPKETLRRLEKGLSASNSSSRSKVTGIKVMGMKGRGKEREGTKIKIRTKGRKTKIVDKKISLYLKGGAEGKEIEKTRTRHSSRRGGDS